eukprot:CAMPEP_0184669982 /NCGR_PEP_ID=MMETSP0308-20130426/79963_1 /TAXON_ID=38269 /ORGANISM="Gloeochaete witrockiana, Strain SAG 46.84" /LENGTH=70 /DNA_ID=CAMNT_0027116497 /DNA_START=323 /DNA_END=532 /DNA_ORIENTATION=-
MTAVGRSDQGVCVCAWAGSLVLKALSNDSNDPFFSSALAELLSSGKPCTQRSITIATSIAGCAINRLKAE